MDGHFLLLTFIRADLGTWELFCEWTQDFRSPKERRNGGSLQGHGAPPSTPRPGPQQLCGESPHKPAITRPGLAREPMSQGLLPLGWGVSAPLRKNFQPETESQLSGRVLCRQEWQRARHFLGGQAEQPLGACTLQ